MSKPTTLVCVLSADYPKEVLEHIAEEVKRRLAEIATRDKKIPYDSDDPGPLARAGWTVVTKEFRRLGLDLESFEAEMEKIAELGREKPE